MRLVISSLALLTLLACEKKVEEVVPAAVAAEAAETPAPVATEVAADAGVAAPTPATVVPVPATPATPVEAATAPCPPSCFTSGTMDDGKPAAGGTATK